MLTDLSKKDSIYLSELGTQNRYVYCGNNPASKADPFGLIADGVYYYKVQKGFFKYGKWQHDQIISFGPPIGWFSSDKFSRKIVKIQKRRVYRYTYYIVIKVVVEGGKRKSREVVFRSTSRFDPDFNWYQYRVKFFP